MSIIKEYINRTPTSKKLHERGCNIFPGGYTRSTIYIDIPYPTYIAKAQGCKVWDVDGNEYIDYINNYGPLILGHNNQKVVEAVKKQLEIMWSGGVTEIEIKLGEKVKELYSNAEKIIFCPTGSEACMKAVRTYRAISGKEKIAMFNIAYHGSSDSLSFQEGTPKDFLNKIVLLPFNDIEGIERLLKENRDELAAVMVEPTLGRIGHEPAKPDFYKAIRSMTKDIGIPLVFDEIVDGFRLAPGGAQERFGVKADMSVLGKVLGGGLPLAAIASSEETMRIWGVQKSTSLDIIGPRIPNTGTYNDTKISIAAGLATIEQLNPQMYSHLEKIGEKVRKGLREICSHLKIKAQVTGIGSLFSIFFTDEPIVTPSDVLRANKLVYRYFTMSLLNKGIIFGKGGNPSFCSTAMTEEIVNKTLEAAEESLMKMRPLIEEIAPPLIN